MNTLAQHPSDRARQRGAILVTSLLLLLILTVLGIAMMKMTNMQDRMAGNTRDVNLAFQGAEAAVRTGEEEIRLLIAPAGGPQLEATAACAICDTGVLPVDIDAPGRFNWTANATPAPGIKTPGKLDDDPQYKVEHTQFVANGMDCGTTDANCNAGRDVFTVTGRSTGASGRANTVVQTTYARRF